jgi:hypothetical protein
MFEDPSLFGRLEGALPWGSVDFNCLLLGGKL